MITEYLIKRWETVDGHACRVLLVQRQTVTTWVAGSKITREQAQRFVMLRKMDHDGKLISEREER